MKKQNQLPVDVHIAVLFALLVFALLAHQGTLGFRTMLFMNYWGKHTVVCLAVFVLVVATKTYAGPKELLVFMLVASTLSEICQPLLPFYNEFEWWDMLANAIGCGIGYAYIKKFGGREQRQNLAL
ncbi:hypothetical protein KA478_04580 [Patescibacteria group bacterium]|nr:hypothetical protein [Patescibacteria group bacterium]